MTNWCTALALALGDADLDLFARFNGLTLPDARHVPGGCCHSLMRQRVAGRRRAGGFRVG
ncbi:MAG: hypothetical protein IT182_15215 [Acidobacteria bacterium]|nr:hypothetical protein [Acidobacteriota bacterium]